jgi:hypothetical protein
MEALYHSLLSRVHHDDQIWIKEILRFLVVAERPLNVDELRDAVEGSLHDQLASFHEFLELECGPILHLLPEEESPAKVQLVHETFRTCLLSQDCQPEFYIDEGFAHGLVAMSCMQTLSHPKLAGTFIDYASRNWIAHLTKSTLSVQLTLELLSQLRQMCLSDDIGTWVRFGFRDYFGRVWIHDWLPELAESYIGQILEWLSKSSRYLANKNFNKAQQFSQDDLNSIEWARQILIRPKQIGQLVGKAAARLWLCEQSSQWHMIEAMFLLALKHFLERDGRISRRSLELQLLTATDFRDMITWSELSPRGSVLSKNLGVAFFATRQCISKM